MNKFRELLKTIGFLLILIGFFCLTAWGIWYIFRLFNSLEPPVEAAIITAIVGFTSLIISNFYTSQREINLKLREKKVEVYSQFLEAWIKTLLNIAKSNQDVPESNLQDYNKNIQEFSDVLREITDDLILWGSDEIIKEYSDLRIRLPKEDSSEFEKQIGIIKFGKFMLSLRNDIGHKNKGIDEYDLMSLFINDIDKLRVLKPQIDNFFESTKEGITKDD
jgi:hypothetical protein